MHHLVYSTWTPAAVLKSMSSSHHCWAPLQGSVPKQTALERAAELVARNRYRDARPWLLRAATVGDALAQWMPGIIFSITTK